MSKRFVFATNNAYKLAEVSAMVGRKIEILSMGDIGCHDDIPETADTLQGNALQKARYIWERYHTDCFADDTGLEVKALGGQPGIMTARYAGGHNDSEANMRKLLQVMEGLTDRRARFRTVFALIVDGKEHLFEGVIRGQIATQRRGTGGFGYDPIFVPDGFTQTFSEMTPQQKNQISHRAEAARKLCRFLAQ